MSHGLAMLLFLIGRSWSVLIRFKSIEKFMVSVDCWSLPDMTELFKKLEYFSEAGLLTVPRNPHYHRTFCVFLIRERGGLIQ